MNIYSTHTISTLPIKTFYNIFHLIIIPSQVVYLVSQRIVLLSNVWLWLWFWLGLSCLWMWLSRWWCGGCPCGWECWFRSRFPFGQLAHFFSARTSHARNISNATKQTRAKKNKSFFRATLCWGSFLVLERRVEWLLGTRFIWMRRKWKSKSK